MRPQSNFGRLTQILYSNCELSAKAKAFILLHTTYQLYMKKLFNKIFSKGRKRKNFIIAILLVTISITALGLITYKKEVMVYHKLEGFAEMENYYVFGFKFKSENKLLTPSEEITILDTNIFYKGSILSPTDIPGFPYVGISETKLDFFETKVKDSSILFLPHQIDSPCPNAYVETFRYIVCQTDEYTKIFSISSLKSKPITNQIISVHGRSRIMDYVITESKEYFFIQNITKNEICLFQTKKQEEAYSSCTDAEAEIVPNNGSSELYVFDVKYFNIEAKQAILLGGIRIRGLSDLFFVDLNLDRVIKFPAFSNNLWYDRYYIESNNIFVIAADTNIRYKLVNNSEYEMQSDEFGAGITLYWSNIATKALVDNKIINLYTNSTLLDLNKFKCNATSLGGFGSNRNTIIAISFNNQCKFHTMLLDPHKNFIKKLDIDTTEDRYKFVKLITLKDIGFLKQENFYM